MEPLNLNKARHYRSNPVLPVLYDSGASDFVPFYNGFHGKVVWKRGIVSPKKVLLYQKSSFQNSVSFSSRKDMILPSFMEAMVFSRFYPRGTNKEYFIKKGQVWYQHAYMVRNEETQIHEHRNEVYPLIILGIRSDYLFHLNRDKIDYTQFCLFVDFRIFTEEHKWIKTAFSAYMKDVIGKGKLDVCYTSDVEQHFYKQSYRFPSFTTITEMQQYITNLNSEIYANEDYARESYDLQEESNGESSDLPF